MAKIPEGAKRSYQGKIIDVWSWSQPLFDGTEAPFECIVRPDTATVIPFLDKDTVILTRQEQPHKPTFMDFPGGRNDPGESLEETARRELLEETGYSADSWLEWHTIDNAGLNRFSEGLFLAKGLKLTRNPALDAGERIELMTMPWKDVVKLCLERGLRQPNVMLAVLRMTYDQASRGRLDGWKST